ncbi:hypothetical protein CTAYLR_010457 [Chrysophaeum taylorii]|uniref:VDE lipocalin domain-containing protein n=1 Tax=Chrysophaeum taylorii TaxID=2483200 RepID=A0AAD7U847_9STRA|nr:hypothetical protein CTAYLR_010457 [Chrysophaeum taylorii]
MRALLVLGAVVAWRPAMQPWKAQLRSAVLCGTLVALGVPPAPAAEPASTTQGFSELAAEGGVMKAEPSCFINECGAQTRACFGNPSCLKGVTCLGQCRGEQLCATRCFARFGSDRLNNWLSCTLEDKKCVTTGVAQDTSTFYANAPQRVVNFDANELRGAWWKVRGYSAKYDCFACQINTFSKPSNNRVTNDIEFRVPKLGGNAPGYWQNSLVETLVDDRGPQGKATLTVDGKMYGLSFHEQWYVLSSSKTTDVPDIPDHLFVAYKGDTQQGPYDGAFVFTRTKTAYDDSPGLRNLVTDVARKNGLDPTKFCRIDNSCPTVGTERAGASDADLAREKLTWRDVFELTEWLRPGTLKKNDAFDPANM